MSILKHFVIIVFTTVLLIGFVNCSEYTEPSHIDLNSTDLSDRPDTSLPPVVGEKKYIQAKARRGNRIFVSSVLKDIFLPDDESSYNDSDRLILNYIENLVTSQSFSFGGPCYKHNEKSKSVGGQKFCDSSKSSIDVVGKGNISRQGYRIRACQEVLQLDRAVTNALNAASILDEKPNHQNYQYAYNLFYPGKSVDTEQLQIFDQLLDSLSGESTLNQWRMILSAICLSTGWEIS